MKREIVAFTLLMVIMFSLGFSQEFQGPQSLNTDITILPEEGITDFGSTVACGDVNGDGFDDILIGVPIYNEFFEPVTGYVYVIYGKENLLDTIDLGRYLESWTKIIGESESDIGSSLFVGDVNSDGIEDCLIGAERTRSAGLFERGAVYVLYGHQDGWGIEQHFSHESPGIRIFGENQGDHLGNSVTSGDVNGDGLTDILMGAPSMERPGIISTIPGGVFIVLQPQDAFDPLINLNAYQGDVIKVFGRNTNDRCGWDIAAGNINQDGIDDFLIGAYKANPHVRDEGEAYYIEGSTDLPPAIDLNTTESLNMFQGDEFAEHMGYCIALGDLNGDGWGDFIFGSRQASNDTLSLAGRVRLVFGSSDTVGVMDFGEEPPDVDILGGVANGQLGTTICTGHLNGDGIEDLIVGASIPLVTGATQSGRVYVFNGRDDWPDTINLLSDTATVTIMGKHEGDWFGASVASGDINGDGVDDVVIGAPRVKSTGRVFVVFSENQTGIQEEREYLPVNWTLSQNYPNPFNQQTMIPVEVSSEKPETQISNQRTTIQILNVMGEVLQQWDISQLSPGKHLIPWTGVNNSGQPFPSGIYICQLKTQTAVQTRKMILVR